MPLLPPEKTSHLSHSCHRHLIHCHIEKICSKVFNEVIESPVGLDVSCCVKYVRICDVLNSDIGQPIQFEQQREQQNMEIGEPFQESIA